MIIPVSVDVTDGSVAVEALHNKLSFVAGDVLPVNVLTADELGRVTAEFVARAL